LILLLSLASLSLLGLLKDFLPALRMYAPLFFFSLSTAVAIAVVRSSNNHKKKRERAEYWLSFSLLQKMM